MNTRRCFDYEAPSSEVIHIDPELSFLGPSSIEGSSSEGFQDEDSFESIW